MGHRDVPGTISLLVVDDDRRKSFPRNFVPVMASILDLINSQTSKND